MVVRIVLVAETFLPQMNGVVNSVLQILRHLESLGHETLVIAPRSAHGQPTSEHSLHGAQTALLPSIPLPGYPEVRVIVATVARLEGILRDYRPDVVHLASPFILGWQALQAAERIGIPTVAVYQTDIPGYAERYGITAAAPALTRHLTRIHQRATLTLAPSTSAMEHLSGLGVTTLKPWARGVDGVRFHPAKRSERWRSAVTGNRDLIIGYVGRLAPEKQVGDLLAIADLPGTRLVIVGDGPERTALERLLPNAVFVGFLGGDELAQAVASFDLFVHPGENETFCQTIQEALASGVPVIATGRGGPLDLVTNSRTGWLYRPGDLDDLRSRVVDLVGDAAKRRAFASAARESVAHRTWSSLGDALLEHYRSVSSPTGSAALETTAVTAWRSYIALGDSLTEGLCDTSRQADGQYRGWADRLADLLAGSGPRVEPLTYANLAVRSRRIRDVLDTQIPRALELAPDLVTVLVGANDLVQFGARPEVLALRLSEGVHVLRKAGIEVVLVAPFAPPRRSLRLLHARMRRFTVALRIATAASGAIVLDFTTDLVGTGNEYWAEDRVHLSARGHRVLSYRVADVLGLPGIENIGVLDMAMHDEEANTEQSWVSTAGWLWSHVRPWAGRRLLGRTAGDGLVAKHDSLVPIVVSGPVARDATLQSRPRRTAVNRPARPDQPSG